MKLLSQIIIGLVGFVIGIKILISFFTAIIYSIKNTKKLSLLVFFKNYNEYVDRIIDKEFDIDNELSDLKILFIFVVYFTIPLLSLFIGIAMWVEWAFR